MRLKKKNNRTLIVIVPDHKEIEKGTLNSILRQANLSREEFIRLLER
ncbi:type II toxin-antitoxin system HicA family toxin [Candidatus Pyrohabitans sp.]